jgi:hypothetical protein
MKYENEDFLLEEIEADEIEALKVKDTEEIKELLLLKRELRNVYYKLSEINTILDNNARLYIKKEDNEDLIYAFHEFNNVIKKFDSFDKNILNIVKTIERPTGYAFKLQKTQLKKFISVDEFSEIFGYSKSSQQNFRSRLYNPIPFLQDKKKGKIIYDIEKVKLWLTNNSK